MTNHDLKRLWYCNHTHAKTGGCVCKNHPDKLPKCEAILNTPLQQIDQIRAEKRKRVLPRPRYPWADVASVMAQYQAQMRMARHGREVEIRRVTDYSGLEMRMMHELPIQHMITFDELQRWPSVFKREPHPTEGAPSVPKSWHKFIEPNHRKKPR